MKRRRLRMGTALLLLVLRKSALANGAAPFKLDLRGGWRGANHDQQKSESAAEKDNAAQQHAASAVPQQEPGDQDALGEEHSWSPLRSAAGAVYTRSPLVPAVQVLGPQVMIVANAVGIGAEKIRRHVNVPTAAAVAMTVLPLVAQRNAIRAAAMLGVSGAAFAAAREAQLARLLPSVLPLNSDRPSWAVVTGCGERAGIGASVARALAARGFGVVVVASREADAKVVARRLRLDYGAPCVALAADFDADAAASVHTLRVALRQANLHSNVDVVVHAPESLRYRSNDNDHAEDIPNEERDFVDVQARCGAATQLAHLFGADMAARGRGRCAFVVGGASAELNAALSATHPPDAVAWFAARSSFAAAEAHNRALARSLRGDLARFGVGITLATRDAPVALPLPWSKAPSSPPGDLLVDALLRGDREVALATPNPGGLLLPPRFAAGPPIVVPSPPLASSSSLGGRGGVGGVGGSSSSWS